MNFKDKKITVMGLGLLGGALNDAKFLVENGANLTITDLKTEKELAPSIKKLSKYKNIKFVLGRHELDDFKKVDLILQPGNVPKDSIYLKEARKNNIPIYESESLFLEYAKDIKVVGITGTRGKTTTTYLIYEILKLALGEKVHLAGNIKGSSTLSLLKKINPGDIVVLELDSWCLNGLGSIKKSPHISVFTNLFSDHLNYYLKGSKDEEEAEQKYFEDKANIYLNQNKNDFLICGEKISKKIIKVKGQKIIAKKSDVPKDWKLKIKGEHNLENIACAIKVCEVFNIPTNIIKKGVENFTGVEGRLEFLCEHKGVKIYNDTCSTTPDATLAGLKALSEGPNAPKSPKTVLIMGGSDKNIDMTRLTDSLPKYAKAVVLIPGSGSDKIREILRKNTPNFYEVDTLKSAVSTAFKLSQKGDTILFSPGFASFGMFKNEFDRGEKFLEIIKKLK